jgi:hypothetical protein
VVDAFVLAEGRQASVFATGISTAGRNPVIFLFYISVRRHADRRETPGWFV